MPPAGFNNEAALLVGTLPRGEGDSLVRLFCAGHGAVQLLARGIRKPGSKLAGQLKPADELVFSASPARAGAPILTALSCRREHRAWQSELHLLALYWFMLECAWLSSADDHGNADCYRLIVNLLRSDPAPAGRHSLACMFCVRLLAIHGMLPDLLHDGETDALLQSDAVTRPAFEELLDAARFSGIREEAGLVRIEAERLQRWRRLFSEPLLEYPALGCDARDAALLVAFTRQHVAQVSDSQLKSGDFLLRQWKLESLRDILRSG